MAADHSQSERDLRNDDSTVACTALVDAVLLDPDNAWVRSWILCFAGSDELARRRCAATCLGHYARLRKQSDPEIAAALERLINDTRTYGVAVEAKEYFEIYAC